MQAPSVPFCIDCCHHRVEQGVPSSHQCHYGATVDVVTGRSQMVAMCDAMRSERGNCGPEGKHFGRIVRTISVTKPSDWRSGSIGSADKWRP